MGNVRKWFTELDFFVLFRRKPKQPSSQHNTKLSTHVNSEQNNPSPTNPQQLLAMNTQNCSPFYLACRNNDVKTVEQLLGTFSADDVDRMEPNGSTSLHAASFYGHKEIVRLLLEKGANRAILNKHGLFPFDEAKDPTVREIFLRVPNSNRLVSREGHIEWERMDNRALQVAIEERYTLKQLYDKKTTVGSSSTRDMFKQIEENYIGKCLANAKGIDQISRFFRHATEEEDPIWIITAYTAETNFYEFLNRELAVGSKEYDSERKYIVILLLYHPKLEPLSYTGVSYRTMKITDSLLDKYRGNEMLMTKTLISSSVEAKIALWFSKRSQEQETEDVSSKRFSADGQLLQQWVLCKYTIKHRRSALYIEEKSQYAMEAEVLIMPYTVFKVKQVVKTRPSFIPEGFQISMVEFEECDTYSV